MGSEGLLMHGNFCGPELLIKNVFHWNVCEIIVNHTIFKLLS